MKDADMRLTVCTAIRNALSSGNSEEVERCIRSVAAIPCEHEHLVFDGGSTDGTVELLRRLSAEIQTLRFVSESDEGIYDALNKGVCAAKGIWFYVLGADDYILSPEVLVHHMNLAEMESAEVLISPVETCDGLIPKLRSKIYRFSRGMAYPHQGVLIRTALARKLGGYDASCRIAGDYKLHLAAHVKSAQTCVAWKAFAYYSVSGVSSNTELARAESRRMACEVLDLSTAEAERYKTTGNIPWRIVFCLLKSSSAFTRRFGISLICEFLWHKWRTEGMSVRCLMGMPICRHLRKGQREGS